MAYKTETSNEGHWATWKRDGGDGKVRTRLIGKKKGEERNRKVITEYEGRGSRYRRCHQEEGDKAELHIDYRRIFRNGGNQSFYGTLIERYQM